ncbi:MAG: enoyl-CoA hydratase-related protein [Pseudomonadota bacterium]
MSGKREAQEAPGAVLCERDEGLVTLTLNNPQRLNAMTWDMWTQFTAHWQSINEDDTVRCVIVRGAGERAFCPGNDISEFERFRSNAAEARRLSEHMGRGRYAMLACPHPVIAQIRGACVGGGLEIAAMCDLRICAEDARFGAPLNRIGLTMAYEEMLPIRRIADRATLFEFLVEGMLIDAVDAKQRGLVNRVVSTAALDNAVAESAARILAGPPLVNRWHKRFLERLENLPALSPSDLEEHYLAFETEDYRTGYRAFLDKTEPRFVGR